MRCACIDIGSNTTRLLVAELEEEGLREVLALRVFTLLRRHGGRFPEPCLEEVAAVVAEQVRAAREAGAEEIRTVATAAIRDAANGAALCRAVTTASGLPVEVLSGDEEARLAFAGAIGTLPRAPEGTVAVVDVGGASSEVVCGTAAAGPRWWASVPVGSGSLADRWLAADPPTAEQLAAVREAAAGAVAGLAPPSARTAYAVGGSATSLRRLVGGVLDAETLARGIAALCAHPAAEVARRTGLHEQRVRVLPAGMLVLDAARALLGVPLRVATGGLREGVILERLAPPTSARP